MALKFRNSSPGRRLRAGWLGRLDSNQGMAESKSDQSIANSKRLLKLTAKKTIFSPLILFGYFGISEWKSLGEMPGGIYSHAMRDRISLDDYPFTVEDWTDPNHLEILAACRDVYMAKGAWKVACQKQPNKKLVARWGRSWTVARSWEGD